MSTEKKSYSGSRTQAAYWIFAAVNLLLAGVAAGITIGIKSEVTGCRSALCGDSNRNNQIPASDRPYETEIIEGRDGLFEGLIVYTVLSDSKAGDSLGFEATLYGGGGGKPVTPDGKDEKSAPSGAMMGAKLNCSGASVKCVSNSSEKKPVLRSQDDASWSWTIDTPKAGKAVINLTVTAYLNDTDIVLEEPIPVRQELEIHDAENAFLRFVKPAWKEIVALLTAFGGLGAVLALWQYRRSDRGSGSSGDGDRAERSNSGGAGNESGNATQSARAQPEPTGRPPGDQPPGAADAAGTGAGAP
ncbi:hypothetical protein [Streptomyces chryseus]|uniref:hypothetical protein n=1 Tax=Streptomyces chryseus TaxID=68186 RepID=UPI00110FC56F|nr:hypothetical protein [Streptomyces chryseus]GGX47352.1 hypothetical protein GCM10010353_72050 [Streptomyces chryseus]